MDVNPTKLVAYGLFIRIISDLFFKQFLNFLFGAGTTNPTHPTKKQKTQLFFCCIELSLELCFKLTKIGFYNLIESVVSLNLSNILFFTGH